MNWIFIKTCYYFFRIKKIIRRICYGEERRSMARNSESIIISSVEFNYIGSDEQFNAFLKSVVKDYISENHLLPDEDYFLDKSA